jgi:hypothetical protein
MVRDQGADTERGKAMQHAAQWLVAESHKKYIPS